MSVTMATVHDVERQSTLHDSVVIACSFGKDSLITLDLCSKYFKRVEVLHMVYVKGMKLTEERVQYVKDRWGVDVHIVDHPGSLEHRKLGFRCFPDESVQTKTIKEIYADAKRELGCSLLATGTRMAEDIGRRAAIRRGLRGETAGAWAGDWHPIYDWKHSKEHSDLLPYLNHNNIKPFENLSGSKHGMSNDAKTILWLHDNHPADYQKWLEVFPLASCVVKRRELYGI